MGRKRKLESVRIVITGTDFIFYSQSTKFCIDLFAGDVIASGFVIVVVLSSLMRKGNANTISIIEKRTVAKSVSFLYFGTLSFQTADNFKRW